MRLSSSLTLTSPTRETASHSVPHGSLSGTRLVFCLRLARRDCTAARLSLTSPDLTVLRTALTSLGNNVATCSPDAITQTNYLLTLTAPVNPFFAAAGASTGMHDVNIITRSVESCESIGFASAPYLPGGTTLVTSSRYFAQTDPNIFLAVRASAPTCRDGIPLTADERVEATQLRSGTLRLFAVCDTGSGDDTNYANCPESIKGVL